ncbi:MAG: RdgB/HAM1 family non-canonical purine NTP pyrophosphatase [Gammaproteobacteria bacterium]|nr:RdgB/HAM1 family non-canonical purine NTP pyrophosphatase [Gammaproteobacteria bacterium]
MQEVVLASGNAGKLAELNSLLANVGVLVTPQSTYSLSEAEETGHTFVENALIKARHAAAHTGRAAIADDSGLAVEALHGAPGIYSARYAGANASDAANTAKLLADLREIPAQQRTARFHCLVVYLRYTDDPIPIICQGTWEGQIAFAPAGSNGFGYDPVFYVPSHRCTAAQLPADEKNRISHRARALALLKDQIRTLHPNR